MMELNFEYEMNIDDNYVKAMVTANIACTGDVEVTKVVVDGKDISDDLNLDSLTHELIDKEVIEEQLTEVINALKEDAFDARNDR